MTAFRPGASLVGLLLLAAGACAPTGSLVCTAGPGRTLQSSDVPESSGVAWSRDDPGVFWTVNDGRDGVLFAFDTTGAPLGRVETTGSRLWDVEDLASGPCGDAVCLFLADVGDNGERRETVAIERLEDPGLPAEGSAERVRFPIRYPDGPMDTEAIIVDGDGEVYLVSKGRSAPPTLYRHPGPWVPDSVVTLERVQALASRAPGTRDQVTGATWVPGTDLVLIRTYTRLTAWRLAGGGLEPVPNGEISLGPLQEPQGEAVAAAGIDRVLLTSEGGPFRDRSALHLLQCEAPPDSAGGVSGD